MDTKSHKKTLIILKQVFHVGASYLKAAVHISMQVHISLAIKDPTLQDFCRFKSAMVTQKNGQKSKCYYS